MSTSNTGSVLLLLFGILVALALIYYEQIIPNSSPPNVSVDSSDVKTPEPQVLANDTIPAEVPKVYRVPVKVNNADYEVELTELTVDGVKFGARAFCTAYAEALKIAADAIEDGCVLPVAQNIIDRIQDPEGTKKSDGMVELSVPLKNYQGEEETFLLSFNPKVNTLVDVISVLCTEKREWLGLGASSEEEIRDRCLVPVTEFVERSLRRQQEPVAPQPAVAPADSTDVAELSIPLVNVQGEQETFVVSFNPRTNTLEDVVIALCIQKRVWLGLGDSSDEEVRTRCVIPVAEFVMKLIEQQQQQEQQPLPPSTTTSATATDGSASNMIELTIPVEVEGKVVPFAVRFDPVVNTVAEVAIAFCAEHAEQFGLSTVETIQAQCVNPIGNYIISLYEKSRQKANNQSSGDVAAAAAPETSPVAASTTATEADVTEVSEKSPELSESSDNLTTPVDSELAGSTPANHPAAPAKIIRNAIKLGQDNDLPYEYVVGTDLLQFADEYCNKSWSNIEAALQKGGVTTVNVHNCKNFVFDMTKEQIEAIVSSL